MKKCKADLIANEDSTWRSIKEFGLPDKKKYVEWLFKNGTKFYSSLKLCHKAFLKDTGDYEVLYYRPIKAKNMKLDEWRKPKRKNTK